MRTRTEVELEKAFHADKVVPDGSEERQLLGLILEVLLDIRDGAHVAMAIPPAPVASAGAAKTPNENWG